MPEAAGSARQLLRRSTPTPGPPPSTSQQNLGRLEASSRAFHDALFASTLPPYVLDAVSSQASIIRTHDRVCAPRTARFYGFEGCNDNAGCCPMNCTHVWNYEQALAFLFPALERTMRDDRLPVQHARPTGNMAFRTAAAARQRRLWSFTPPRPTARWAAS